MKMNEQNIYLIIGCEDYFGKITSNISNVVNAFLEGNKVYQFSSLKEIAGANIQLVPKEINQQKEELNGTDIQQ